MVKGAPDILLGRCTSFVKADGHVEPLIKQTLDVISQLKDRWSSDGKRVILLARKNIKKDIIAANNSSAEMEESILREANGSLIFVGLLALIDPPRPEIPEVMRTLRGAGIQTFMVRRLHGGGYPRPIFINWMLTFSSFPSHRRLRAHRHGHRSAVRHGNHQQKTISWHPHTCDHW